MTTSSLQFALAHSRLHIRACTFALALIMCSTTCSLVLAQETTSSDNHLIHFYSVDDLTDAQRTTAGLLPEQTGTTVAYASFNFGEAETNNRYYPLHMTPGSQEYSWFRVNYANDKAGMVTLAGHTEDGAIQITVSESTGFSGYANDGDKILVFTPIDETLSEVSIHTTDLDATPTYAGNDDVAPHTPYTGTTQYTGEESCTIDVLFLRTQSAEDYINSPSGWGASSFDNLVERVTAHTNLTLTNTNIGSKRINPIVHPYIVPQLQYATTGSGVGLCYSAMNVLKTDQTIQALRQTYDADVVVYYTDALTGCGGIAGGIGVSYNDAYVLNDISAELNQYSLHEINTHELGHVFGGLHSRHHVLTQGDEDRRTMMQSGAHRNVTIDHYSNPNVDFLHLNTGVLEPTGTNSKNNGLRVNTNFCRQADFQLSGEMQAAIRVGYDPKGACNDLVLNANVLASSVGGPGSGPFTYEWRVRTSPWYSSSNVLSTSNVFNYTLPDLDRVYYVWLNVTNAAGITVQVMTSVSALCADEIPQVYTAFERTSGNANATQIVSEHFNKIVLTSDGASTTVKLPILDDPATMLGSLIVVRSIDGRMLASHPYTGTRQQIDLLQSVSGVVVLSLYDNHGDVVHSEKVALFKG